eukprot:CAMPEP_0180704854 /NCGR_PEP_ID=MMETSP1038_2-20121128/7367_1 /TAXON_ID=632150 /ORGANISM="Azadinium spinosum, Strain 3D9" /LENGTH=336 /DNA_ID=CAMNT_0022736693 /DNA_START=458 /DNA_END=1465 /DNA_ORIENTATION=+
MIAAVQACRKIGSVANSDRLGSSPPPPTGGQVPEDLAAGTKGPVDPPDRGRKRRGVIVDCLVVASAGVWLSILPKRHRNALNLRFRRPQRPLPNQTRSAHRPEVNLEAEVQRGTPCALTARPVLIPALPDLGAAMALAHLAGLESVESVPIHIRGEHEKGTRITLDRVERAGISAIFASGAFGFFAATADPLLLKPSPHLAGWLRSCEALVAPRAQDVEALMRLRIPVVVVATAPEAVEELRVVTEPLRPAEVGVIDLQVLVSGQVRNVLIHGKAAICGEAGTSAQEEDVRIAQCQGRYTTTVVQENPRGARSPRNLAWQGRRPLLRHSAVSTKST